ncbi:DUF5071 domain-containing protein [Pseudoalteromonas luteoviolacea]|uniref:DUF5071 domain-containing protein n=1 Tax=Pseudoalteromonas luteoviolacea TaxID=43657 RepID=UPI001F1BEE20|nr:DUF5071 domain-containing protein [Pseudoalteromonas luteoviolacea]MCF6443069.1 DUF5071 domain-containing protein [Pseudoalteromonas luteoviolacea]
MEFLPKIKSDLTSIEKLKSASNEEIRPYLLELAEWLQDINWPVAQHVALRLVKAGDDIVPVVKKILSGNDDIWKYHVINNLVVNLEAHSFSKVMSEITRIVNEPTQGEISEEVHLVARDAMVLYGHNV